MYTFIQKRKQTELYIQSTADQMLAFRKSIKETFRKNEVVARAVIGQSV
jgi:hypothetical protein